MLKKIVNNVSFLARIYQFVLLIGIGLGLSLATGLIWRCISARTKRRTNSTSAADTESSDEYTHEGDSEGDESETGVIQTEVNTMGNEKSHQPPPIQYNEAQRIRNLKRRGPNAASLGNIPRAQYYEPRTRRTASLNVGLHEPTSNRPSPAPPPLLSSSATSRVSEQTPLPSFPEVAEAFTSHPPVNHRGSPPTPLVGSPPELQESVAVVESLQINGDSTPDCATTPLKRVKMENVSVSENVESSSNQSVVNDTNTLGATAPRQTVASDSLAEMQLELGEDYVIVENLPSERWISSASPPEPVTFAREGPLATTTDSLERIKPKPGADLVENTSIPDDITLRENTSIPEDLTLTETVEVNVIIDTDTPASHVQSVGLKQNSDTSQILSLPDNRPLSDSVAMGTGVPESFSTSETLTPIQSDGLTESRVDSMLSPPLVSLNNTETAEDISQALGADVLSVSQAENTPGTTYLPQNIHSPENMTSLVSNSGPTKNAVPRNSLTDSGYIGSCSEQQIMSIQSTDSRDTEDVVCMGHEGSGISDSGVAEVVKHTGSEGSSLSDSVNRDLDTSIQTDAAEDIHSSVNAGDSPNGVSTFSAVSTQFSHCSIGFEGNISIDEDTVSELQRDPIDRCEDIRLSNLVHTYSFDGSLLTSAQSRRRSFRESKGGSSFSPATTPVRSASLSSSSLSLDISLDPNALGEALVKCCNQIEKEVMEISKNLVEDENIINRLMKEDTAEWLLSAGATKKLSNMMATSNDYHLSAETLDKGFELSSQNYYNNNTGTCNSNSKRMSSVPPTPESNKDHSLRSDSVTKSNSIHDIQICVSREEMYNRETIDNPSEHSVSAISNLNRLSSGKSDNMKSQSTVKADHAQSGSGYLMSGHAHQPVVLDIQQYAAQEWKSTTPTAQSIRKGYQSLVEEHRYSSIVRIRGDNYCALRATYCSVVLNSLLSVELIVNSAKQRLEKLFQTEPSILHSWKFSDVLPNAGPGESYDTLCACLDFFKMKTKSLYKLRAHEERRDHLFQFLNSGFEEEIYIMESLKLIMFLSAYDLYKTNLSGGDVPVFVWLLFARDTSENPAKFLTNHLNQVGDTAGLEQVEMFLLGHSLGVTLQTFRLYQFGNADFIAFYPEDDNTRPVIPLIAEDDRHYNTVIRQC